MSTSARTVSFFTFISASGREHNAAVPDRHVAVTFDGQRTVFTGEFPTRDDDRFTAATMQLMRVKARLQSLGGGVRGGGATSE